MSTPESTPLPPRFRLYRLCPCEHCGATGKMDEKRCPVCRGEARTLRLVAECHTSESVGVALITCAREGEWEDCPFGLIDVEGEKGKRWLIRPWEPSPRNVSDAGRVLQSARKERP